MKLIHFTADWCNPCKQIKPIIDKFVEEHSDLEYTQIDVDNNMPKAMEYSVKSIPTLIFEDNNGSLLYRHQGVITEEKIKEIYNS